ncbi:hypothetical protein, partial [Mycobacterium tuberculosis]|uniref:hypothetical protein n=1 Tax=Mycobacterium tuberculosis TaxID=1773 RepID=UPI0021C85D5B
LINQPTRPTTEVLIDELEDNGDKWYVNFKDDGYMELPVWEAPIGSIMSYHININEYNQEQYILDSVDNSVFLKGTADGLWSFDDTAMIIKVNGREIINGYVVPYDTNLVM